METLHSGKCDCFLRIWWRRVIAISISCWMTRTRCFFTNTFVGYLDNLMSILGIWKCLGKSAFRQMRLFPQKLVATCYCNFDFKLDDWNQMHFCQHILLAISTTSGLFLEFESVLESLHSGKCDCFLRSWWRRVIAISISSWMTGTRCTFAKHILLAISTISCPFFEFESVLESLHSGKCNFSQKLVATCNRNFDFKLDDWNQMHFCQRILLAISTTSGLFSEFESVLESLHSGKRDFSQNLVATCYCDLISSWMTGTRCFFTNTFCCLSWQPFLEFESVLESLHSGKCDFFSEFGSDGLLQFRFQVGWLESDAFWPTFCCYLATDKTTYIVTKQQTMQHK